MPVDCGSTTARTAAAVTAASMALPPARKVSTAAAVANGCDVAAIASVARTGERPGSWKSLKGLVSLVRGSAILYPAAPGRELANPPNVLLVAAFSRESGIALTVALGACVETNCG